MDKLHLIVLSRAPVAGQTKTRLIPTLGAEGARDFHVACLNDLLSECLLWRGARAVQGRAPVKLHLFVTPPGSQPAFGAAGVQWPEDYMLHDQQGADLGARMSGAISSVLEGAAEGDGVILVGSDLPLLRASHLELAARALERSDVVFGPSTDGGYYLIGVKTPHPWLFDRGGWGNSSVLSDALDAAREHGLSTSSVSRLPDADTGEDLRVILAHSSNEDSAMRSSLRFIRERLSQPIAVA